MTPGKLLKLFAAELGKARSAALAILLILASASAAAQNKKPAKPETPPPPKRERMTAGYNLADQARDPFFTPAEQLTTKPAVPSDPTARELLPLLSVSGIIGKPEDPDAAGLLVNAKLYRIGDSIPVRFGNSAYQLVLVKVIFPDRAVLKYKDETVTLAVGKNNKSGD